MKSRICFLWLSVCLLVGSPEVFAQFAKRSWPANAKVPSIDYTDLTGQVLSWQQLQGKVVVINFWATWCAPCTEELPSLQRLQEMKLGSDLVVITINHKERLGKIRSFNLDTGFNLPVVADSQGEIAKNWGIKIFPTSVILSREGKPTWIIEGSADWTSKELLDLL